jgi:hypothetical protein
MQNYNIKQKSEVRYRVHGFTVEVIKDFFCAFYCGFDF